jgi:hypothetical protein
MASFLSDLFSGGAEKDAAQQDRGAALQYQNQANQALTSAYGTGTTAINQGVQAFQPLANLGAQYSRAATPYMAAMGVGTPAQVAAAQTGFTQTPGYQALMNSALQGVQRQEAAGGMGASGNADIAALMGATGVTSNAYQQYINNLQNAGTMGLQATGAAATGQAGQYDALAGLAQNYGQNQASVYGNVMGTNVGANNLAAAGEAAGAKNLLGAGLSLATLGMGGNPFGGSMTGGGGGGGSLLSTIMGNNPAYGMGNPFTNAYGGSSSNPLPGLTAADYGAGY